MMVRERVQIRGEEARALMDITIHDPSFSVLDDHTLK